MLLAPGDDDCFYYFENSSLVPSIEGPRSFEFSVSRFQDKKRFEERI